MTMITDHGATTYDQCSSGGGNRCHCEEGKCHWCQFSKHTAIHGPLLNQPEGSKPWGHKFETTAEVQARTTTTTTTEPRR